MKRAFVVVACVLAIMGVFFWLNVHARHPSDSLRLLDRFYSMMDEAAAGNAPLDVSARVCGAISRDQLESLRAEVGDAVIRYLPGRPGFWQSERGDEVWSFSRMENLLWERTLNIRMNATTGDCSARVALYGP